METISQLVTLLFALIILQVLSEQAVFELKNKAPLWERAIRLFDNYKLLFFSYLTICRLISPDPTSTEKPLFTFLLKALEFILLVGLPLQLVREVHSFYRDYELTKPRKGWVILGQLYVALVIIALLLG